MIFFAKQLISVQHFLIMNLVLHCKEITAEEIEIAYGLRVRSQELLTAVSCFTFLRKVRYENIVQNSPIIFFFFISIVKFIPKICLTSLLKKLEKTVKFSHR